ncbi:MAG: phospholipase [Myxococcota bacterium]
MLKLGIFLCAAYSLWAGDFYMRYESMEHARAGDEIVLKIGEQAGRKNVLLKLQNGLDIGFGDLMTLGDFYGIVGAPISSAPDLKSRRDRFTQAFNTFSASLSSVEETKSILAAIREGPLALKDDQHRRWNCLTGGACSGYFWWLSPGRYLNLAEQDFDHFGDNAVKAYIAGHEAALSEAVKGNLGRAYAMDGFACHFLSDRFAAGHIRTPRDYLALNVTPAFVGSLLAGFMHDEENLAGVHVVNEYGDRWIAYGDERYQDPLNSTNKAMMLKALQASVDEVYLAYQTKQLPAKYQHLALLPMAVENGANGKVDIAPLFYWDRSAQKVMRRNNLGDARDYSWTADWYGWSTLAKLKAM